MCVCVCVRARVPNYYLSNFGSVGATQKSMETVRLIAHLLFEVQWNLVQVQSLRTLPRVKNWPFYTVLNRVQTCSIV